MPHEPKSVGPWREMRCAHFSLLPNNTGHPFFFFLSFWCVHFVAALWLALLAFVAPLSTNQTQYSLLVCTRNTTVAKMHFSGCRQDQLIPAQPARLQVGGRARRLRDRDEKEGPASGGAGNVGSPTQPFSQIRLSLPRGYALPPPCRQAGLMIPQRRVAPGNSGRPPCQRANQGFSSLIFSLPLAVLANIPQVAACIILGSI